MFLAFAGLVLLAEGRLIAALTGFGAMAGWGTAGIFLDKADLGAFGSGIAAVVIAAAFGTLAWYLNTATIVRPDSQSVLYFTAAICVFFVTLMSFAQTPAEIVPGRLAITSAFVAVAFVIVACALAGTATVHIGRWAITALALSLLPLGVIAYRRAYGEPMDLDYCAFTFGPAIVMLAALTWLAGRWPKDPRRLASVIALLLLVVPVMATVGTLIAVRPVSASLTN
ncbi:hypothetical protein [Catelliglobosispora koreensis]|uniref:hypothetical protein n=1 Tax=Catelliglobosispora koreensis TaxID=129052 RepID=UPI00035C49D5|nr:hypothetical protein [Catelliglobosispora koreensis]